MMDVYFAESGNSLRALLVLEECGVSYRAHRIDLTKAEQKTPEFLRINAFGTVPVLDDPEGAGGAGLRLVQSVAIMFHVAEKTRRLIPEEPGQRAEMMNWLMMGASDLGPANTLILYMNRSVPDLGDAGRRFLIERFMRCVRVLEAHLSACRGPYIVGPASLADFAILPAIRMRRALLEDVGEFPRVLAWMDLLLTRPSVRRAVAALTAEPSPASLQPAATASARAGVR